MKKTILWILCIAWAIIIFMFSNEPATVSDQTSLGFTENVIMFLVKIDIVDIPVSSVGLEETVRQIAENLNNIIRKIAHFSIYLVLGVLVYNLLLCYVKNKKAVLVALLTCLLYAISDEIHQIFIPGRAGQIKDVLIDFSGSFTGLILTLLYNKMKKCLE